MFRLANTSQRRIVRPAIYTTALVLAVVASPPQPRAELGECGQPISAGASPVATDALFVLGAAVGTQSCERCVCDVNDDGAITATDALIDLSAAVGQAVSLECSSCPLECPDGDGCELSEGMIEEDQPLVLQTSGGRVTVPPNALPAGIVVTLREMTPGLADSLPEGLGEELLSNVFDLTLSDVVQPAAPIVLDALVADPVPTYFRGRLKVIKPPFPTEATEESWQVYVGRFDESTSRLAFTMFGALDRVSAAVVVPTEEQADILRKTASERRAISGSKSGAAAQATTVAPTSKLGEHGWAVGCLGLQYALLDIEDPSCDPNDLAFVVAEQFQEADVFIRSLGLENLRMKTVTRADLERSFLAVAYADPEGVSGELPSSEYFLGFMTPLVETGVRGDYDPTTGLIRVGAHSGFLTQEQASTIAHELMHAVQYGTAPGMAEAQWTIEGIADAVGFAFTESAAATRLAHRRDDVWRNWNVALNSEAEADHAYQTTEFWSSIGGGELGYLGPLYESLATSGAPSSDESYSAVNGAMIQAGLGGSRALADQYISLLQTRNAEEGYPHCSPKSCTLGTTCFGGVGGFQKAMTGECIDLEILGSECPEVASELSVVADQPEFAGALKAIVAGQIHGAGETIQVQDKVRVWPINQDFEDPDEIGYSIVVENHCGCGDGEETPSEECDDGNNVNGDRCSANCLDECGNGVIEGFCTGENVGAACTTDGQCLTVQLDAGVCNLEECDDGNREAGDGCSPTCELECGNGIVDGDEDCDDGDRRGDEDCTSSCKFPPDCKTLFSGSRYLCEDRCCSNGTRCTIDTVDTVVQGNCIGGAGPCNTFEYPGTQQFCVNNVRTFPDRYFCCPDGANCTQSSGTEGGCVPLCGGEPFCPL